MRQPKSKLSVLVIEDDFSLATVLKRTIEALGYYVDAIHDGQQGLELALSNRYSLIIADISLPSLSGYGILQKLKTSGIKTPVIMITNFKDREKELNSYMNGANIFHKKPIDFPLLIAQIRMLVEKYRFRPEIELGDIVVNPQKMVVTKAGQVVPLTKKEFDLVLTLVSSPGDVFTRREIIEITNMNTKDVDESSVDTLVSRIRNKVGTYKDQEVIETVYKKGYKLSRLYLE